MYAVFEAGGLLRWQTPILDDSSGATGSSAFDFDGDGADDIVRDQTKLHVFRGTNGAALFEAALSSCTCSVAPVVSDCDADGSAEIVVVAEYELWLRAGPRGVRLWSGQQKWMPTARIWNQHTYHFTNVQSNGTIPVIEPNHWSTPAAHPYNRFRAAICLDSDGDRLPACTGDCNDNNASVHPGAAESCNGVDDDCDATVDEGGNGLCEDGSVCTDDACMGTAAVHIRISRGRVTIGVHARQVTPVVPASASGMRLPDGAACSDGNSCTRSDMCNAGICGYCYRMEQSAATTASARRTTPAGWVRASER